MEKHTEALTNFVKTALKQLKSGDSNSFSLMIDQLNDCNHEAKTRWYNVLSKLASHFEYDPNSFIMKSFAGTVLSYEWTTADEHSMEAYSQFIIALACSQSALLIPILRSLVRVLAVPSVELNIESNENNENDIQETNYKNHEVYLEDKQMQSAHSFVHNILATIMKLVPISRSRIEIPLSTAFPPPHYHPSYHQMYVKNLLRLSEYAPMLSDRVFGMILERLIVLDVKKLSNKSILESQSNDMEEDTLDSVMEILFQYLSLVRNEDEQLRDQIFSSLLRVFDTYIFTAHKTQVVQFLLFYFSSFNDHYATSFLRHVILKILDKSNDIRTRMVAVSYASDYVIRSNFLVYASATFAYNLFLKTAQRYVVNCKIHLNNIEIEQRNHAVFYSLVQGILHMTVYCCSLLKNSNDNNEESGSEILNTIVNSDLHPLRHIDQELVKTFTQLMHDNNLFDDIITNIDDEGDNVSDTSEHREEKEIWIEDEDLRDEIGHDDIDGEFLSPLVKPSKDTPALHLTLSPTISPIISKHKMLPLPIKELHLTPSAKSISNQDLFKMKHLTSNSIETNTGANENDQVKSLQQLGYYQPFRLYNLKRSKHYVDIIIKQY